MMVVAVEVTPGTETGPYSTRPNIDFGMGGTKDPPKQLRLYMGNSSPRWLRISSVAVRPGMPVNSALMSEDESNEPSTASGISVSLLPNANMAPYQDTHVATLTIDWRSVYDSGICCGSIIVRTKSGGHSIVLPYMSQALQGGLTYNHTIVRFRSSDKNILPLRTMRVTNEFDIGVHITELEFADNLERYFEVNDFKPKAIAPSKSTNIFSIRLKNWTDKVKFQTRVTVHTNITSLVIPIYIYNGKFDIELSIPSEPDILDFGLVGTSSTARATIQLVNTNPVAICIGTYGINLEGGALQFLGCVKDEDDNNITACMCIPAGGRGVASLSTVAPTREAGYLTGMAWIATEHHNHTVKVRLTVAKGRLALAKLLLLDGCFAGTICSHPLKIQSQFYIGMNVISVEADQPDQRIYLSAEEGTSKLIMPRETSYIGDICYNPAISCNGECYTGLDLNSTIGLQWLLRLSLPIDTKTSDIHLLNSRYNMFLNLSNNPSSRNFTLRMDTTMVRLHTFPAAKVVLSWPSIASDHSGPIRLLSAPLVQVGIEGDCWAYLPIRNPSNSNRLLIQLIMDWMLHSYGEDEDLFEIIPKQLRPPLCTPFCSPAPSRAFYFVQPVLNSSSLLKEYELFTKHPDSVVIMLEPEQTINLTIGFNAEDASRITSLLYIRNNLTILEVIRLTGQGAYPSFRFGNRKPGSNVPLLFEVTERHLKDCEKNKKLQAHTTNLTVKRTFTARNTGDIMITVNKFLINGLECEGYGYKVLNCQSFDLAPNTTRKIDIAFTPDFTLSKIHRTLVLETSLRTPVNFSLLTTLPTTLLTQCRASLPRPAWETFMVNLAFYSMAFSAVCIVFSGFIESDRILSEASAGRMREKITVDALLDLKSIGRMGTRNSSKVGKWESGYISDKKQTYPPKPWPDEKPSEQKAINNSISGSVKYEETVPTQRGKKKLAKKNSSPTIESGDASAVIRDKKASQTQNWGGLFSSKSCLNSVKSNDAKESQVKDDTAKLIPKVSADEPPDKPIELRKNLPTYNSNETKLHTQYTNKKQKKNIPYVYEEEPKNKRLSPPCCDEDTSSTTTESSNNDEADKENDESTTSSSKSSSSSSMSKKVMTSNQGNTKKKGSSRYNDNYEGDGEDEEYDHKPQTATQTYVHNTFTQKLKSKENTPTIVKHKANVEKLKTVTESIKVSTSDSSQNDPLVATHKLIKNKTLTKVPNSKRDKQQLSKKRTPVDKSFTFVAKPNVAGIKNSVAITRSSPPSVAPLNCWSENKATFSDVVSRSECASSYSKIVAPHPKVSPELTLSSQNQVIKKYNVAKEPNSGMLKGNKTDLGPIGFYSNRNSWSENTQISPQPPIQKPLFSKFDESIKTNSFFFYGNENSPITPVQEPTTKTIGVIGQPSSLNPIVRPGVYSPSNSDFLNSFGNIDDSLMQPLEEIPTYDDEQTLLRSRGLTGALSNNMVPDDISPLNDFECPWDFPQPKMNSTPIFEQPYSPRNIYSDPNAGWSTNQSLWNHPIGSGSSQMVPDQASNNMATHTSTTSMYSQGSVSEKDAAEWLWGYSSNDTANPANSLRAIGKLGSLNADRTPPGLTQPQEQSSVYDPFHSLNSIWSPSWKVDRWSSNQDKNDNQQQ